MQNRFDFHHLLHINLQLVKLFLNKCCLKLLVNKRVDHSVAVIFNLFAGVEPQGHIPGAWGTPCSHICTGELKITVNHRTCITSGRAPRMC